MYPGKLILVKKFNAMITTQYYYSFDPLTDISFLLKTANLFSMDLSKKITVFHRFSFPQPNDLITIQWEDRIETFYGPIIFAGHDQKNVVSLNMIGEEEIRIKLKEIN